VSARAASSKQLSYLRSLAVSTGTTFTPPSTAAAASREITRLRALKGSGAQRSITLPAEDAALRRELTYGTAPAPGEISGYGSTATWAPPEPGPTDKQLSYIKKLALDAGVEVPEPETRREASAAIDQLLQSEDDPGPPPPNRDPLRTGPPFELARYSIPSGQRVIYGQRVDGKVRVTDKPAEGTGRSYLIDSGLQEDGFKALEALVIDYATEGARLGRVPLLTR
jgi:hypothetical protein